MATPGLICMAFELRMLYIFPRSWGKDKEENASEILHGLQSLNTH